MTQEKLSEKADISLKHLGEIERGRGNPTLATLEVLAKALHVSLPELMPVEDEGKVVDPTTVEIRALVDNADKTSRIQILRVLKAMLAEG